VGLPVAQRAIRPHTGHWHVWRLQWTMRNTAGGSKPVAAATDVIRNPHRLRVCADCDGSQWSVQL